MPKKTDENRKSVIDQRLLVQRKEIDFDPKYKPPLLKLPRDASEGNTKRKNDFDFASVRKKPFSFEIQPEPYEITQDFNIKDDFENIPEPTTGCFEPGFNYDAMDQVKKKIPYVKYIPHNLARTEPMLRSPDSISEHEKIKDITQVMGGNVSLITFISITDVTIDSKYKKSLGKLFSSYTKLECLILRNIGLKDISDFTSLPKLKYCDLSMNTISSLKYSAKLSLSAPWLEILNMESNPVVLKSNFREKLIASNASLSLRILNNVEVTIEERMKSIASHGSKQQKQELDAIRWDLYICKLPEVSAMVTGKTWTPTYIKKLDFPSCNLSVFHVGDMRNLEWLSLPGNKIYDIRGTGIEQCTKLYHLNLKDNSLSKKESLKAICFLNSLREIWLEGNKELGSSYRQTVIYMARNLLGDNRAPGIQQIDGKVVTVEERVAAIMAFEKKENPHSLRWRFNIVQYYGHYQIQMKDFLSRIRHLKLPNKNLQIVNVKNMPNLEVLDLSGNSLRTIEGLEFLTRVKYLNIYDNPKLSLRETLPKLQRMNTLEHVFFGVHTKDHKRYSPPFPFSALHAPSGNNNNNNPNNNNNNNNNISNNNNNRSTPPLGNSSNSPRPPSVPTTPPEVVIPPAVAKYRTKVLKALLFNNPNLKYLDYDQIIADERVETYAILGANKESVETYRFHIGLNNNCTMPWNRRYHPTEVVPGNQYDPAHITVLRRMNNLGLVAAVCNFASFLNLEELNLSGNKLISIHKMGLEKLVRLRILDVHNNYIDSSIKEIASFLDTMVSNSLQIFCIRENPCVKTFNDRLTLIGSMSSMKEISCKLRVIDIEISLDERVEAWKRQGGVDEQCELLRYKAIMYQRTPDDIPLDQITSLDLSYGGLKNLDVGNLKALEVLLLKNNRIASPSAITGLLTLKKLKVLDLRKNLLNKIEEVVETIKALPELSSIGLRGNKFTDQNKNWRAKIIALLPHLHEEYSPFRVIDEQEISCMEVVKAWNVSSQASQDRVRLQVIKLLKVPKEFQTQKELVKEIDASGCDLVLTDIDFAFEFPNLEVLSLKNNSIKSLEAANMENLKALKQLDISGNKIKELTIVTAVINKLPAIQMICVDDNPCWPANAPNDAQLRFCGQISQLDHLGASLTSLNGYPISIAERCKGLLDNHVYNEEGLERFRADLLCEKFLFDEKTEQLLLNGNDITDTCVSFLRPKLLHLPSLRHLDLSNNGLSDLQEFDKLLDNCLKLNYLDIRDNSFNCNVSALVTTIRNRCPGMKKLFILRATNNKETTVPKEYSVTVFSLLPTLETVDGMNHPQVDLQAPSSRRQVKSVFNLFEGNAPPSSYTPNTPPSSHNTPPPPSHTPHPSITQNSYNLPSAPVIGSINDTIHDTYFGTSYQSSLNSSPSTASKQSNNNNNNNNNTNDFEYSPQNTNATTSTLYPELSFNFANESYVDNYLPKDYANTIGRKYDLSALAHMASFELQAQTQEEEED